MMPLVTVLSRPNGEPIATTSWPTFRSADVPSVAGWRPLLPSALMTARSVTASRPRISAFALVPSLNATVIDPPSAADSTTWLLVRIWPSLLMMMPVPDPACPPPDTLTWVTDGSSFWATCSISPAGAEPVSESASSELTMLLSPSLIAS